MGTIIEAEEVDKLLKGFLIPPHPDVLCRFQEERAKSIPNLQAIANIVSSDPGLAACVIKIINSPYFGLRKTIASIKEAGAILGQKNLGNIEIESDVKDNAYSTPAFWIHKFKTS
jgi:HD-like signal output (HDOD) protein